MKLNSIFSPDYILSILSKIIMVLSKSLGLAENREILFIMRYLHSRFSKQYLINIILLTDQI
jgi:hypothetical protein